ncbi:MAG TPA: hypothetical protein VK427_18515 [Kofleriaceae bacterium]|nr:hypothetical protein [Kofleriaceae bacterium]
MRGLVAACAMVMLSGPALAQAPAAGDGSAVAAEVKPKPRKPKPFVFVKSTLPVEMTDFAAQAKVLFRVAACGSDDAIPERFNAKAVDAHCRQMKALYTSYKRAWADQAGKFIAAVRPANLPKTVVYPFGGGDLTSALVVYPDAQEITTISLEAAGDARVIESISKGQLGADIATIGNDVRRLYRSAHSTTKSLQAASHSELPGTLMFAFAALAVHDMEPVAMKYFDIQPDGSLKYLTSGDLDKRAEEFAAAKHARKTSKHYWYEQDSPFSNVEIQFRPRGDAKAPVRTYRHIVANLDDSHMREDGRVLVHLRAKGKVAVITKAASFLLWYDDFSQIRDYLLKHMTWMISDASGIPPSYAEPAGFEQITYGTFGGPYFIKDTKNTRLEFVKMWRKQPKRPLPFRFGYPDQDKQHHLMITRPKQA